MDKELLTQIKSLKKDAQKIIKKVDKANIYKGISEQNEYTHIADIMQNFLDHLEDYK